MRMMYYLVSDTGKLGKKKSECSYQESNLKDLPITSSDALPLGYRRLVGAKAIKLKVHGTNMLHTARIGKSCVAGLKYFITFIPLRICHT